MQVGHPGAAKAFLVGLHPSRSLYLEPMPARGPGTLQGLSKCVWNGRTNIHISLCGSSSVPIRHLSLFSHHVLSHPRPGLTCLLPPSLSPWCLS